MSHYTNDGSVSGLLKAIVRYVTDHGGGVTFVEIEREIPNANGAFDYILDGNVLIWSGLSENAIQAIIHATEKSGPLVKKPTIPLVYLLDGVMPQMPVVKRRAPKGGFKTEHWLPVALSVKSQRK